CSCFFFQAEDGIRAFHVTGVQTCALPIYFPNRFPRRPTSPISFNRRSPPQKGCLNCSMRRKKRPRLDQKRSPMSKGMSVLKMCRSEERRVGKVGTDQWSSSVHRRDVGGVG